MNTSEKILGLLRKAKEIKSGNDYWIDLGTVTEKDMDQNFSGYKRIMDISAIKHSIKKHPNLTEADFCLIPLIVEEPNIIGEGKKTDSIVYKKILDDTYYYVECIRKGRKYLSMKTFYKRKNRPKRK